MKQGFCSTWIAAVVAFVICTLSGCSEFNGTRLEPILGGDVNLVKLGDTVAERLINQSLPPLTPQQPILVTTLVDNDNLNESSSFGRSFQNTIVAGFVSRGFAVREVKLRRNILIEMHKGEFMLTRDLRELAGKQRAQAVVVGTYTMANRFMYLSVRLINPMDQSILSTYEDKLALDENSLRMLGLQLKRGTSSTEAEPVPPPSPSILDDILY
jgi:TolB-like protein